MEFKQYKRKGLSEMVEFSKFEGDMSKISVSEPDKLLSNEEFAKGYIARNPKNHEDMWYVAKKYFDDNLELVLEKELSCKTLNNTTANQAKDQVSDIQFWGTGDAWKLLGKASSKNEGWMKSSKAYEIDGVGCVVQVTTQQGVNIAEAVTFVPGVKIVEGKNEEGKVILRHLMRI